MTDRPTRPLLLDRRMELLGLSQASVEGRDAGAMPRLQRACSSCHLAAQCSRDLASERQAAAVAAYCPNDQALKKLQQD